jgi:hypothetical protein
MEYSEFRAKVEYYQKLIRDNAHEILMKNEKYCFIELENLYFYIFKRNLNVSCGNCYYDAIFELMSINEKIFTDMKNLIWKLKEGKVYRLNGRFWSSQSIDLSNEVCEQLFAMYGENIFEFVPEKSRKKKIVIPADTPTVDATSEQPKAKAKAKRQYKKRGA